VGVVFVLTFVVICYLYTIFNKPIAVRTVLVRAHAMAGDDSDLVSDASDDEESMAVKRPRLASPAPSAASSEDTVPTEVAHANDGYDPEVRAEEDAAIRAAQAAARERAAPSMPAAITFGTVGRSACAHGDGGCASTCSGGGAAKETAPAPLVPPFPTHLPLLGRRCVKGRAVGKYRTKATKRNGNTPQVVCWDGKATRPACWKGDCRHAPAFGFPGAARPTHCGAKGCREDGMVNLKSRMCETCDKRIPYFGFPTDKRATRCGQKGCKEDGMINIRSKKCEACGERCASFGFPGTKRPTRCGQKGCKEDGMVDVVSRKCETCGEHIPVFGFPGAKRATRCGAKGCKEDGMVDLVSKMCEACGEHCASFGFPGATKRPTRCGAKGCKEDGMVNLKSRKCEACGERIATLGFPGAKRATRCGQKGCKEDGMVNIKTRKCEACGEHQPSFGFPGAERPTRCGAEACREDGMVDLRSKKCEACGEHQPSYGFPNDARATRCGAKGCREDGMVDLKSKMCEVCGEHQPAFGFPGAERPTRCGAEACREDGMVNLKNKMCDTCGEHQPSFGFPGAKRPTRCGAEGCREDGMVDIKSKMCACGGGLARYEDADGNKRSLCYAEAIAEGTHPERVAGASQVACRFFCMLSRMTLKREDVPHVHWDKVSGEWNGYDEVEGLVEGRQIRPDGFLPDPLGATKGGTVYLFHGNRWHGYPPGHPAHGGEQVFRSARTGIERRVSNADLYAKTEADSQAYLAAGYTVVEMWEHDFKEVEKLEGLLMSKLVRRAPP
jgi:hypothetical protein